MAPRTVAPDQLLRGRFSDFRIAEVSEPFGITSTGIFTYRPAHASSLLQRNLSLCPAYRPYRAGLDRRTGYLCTGTLPTIDGFAVRMAPGMALATARQAGPGFPTSLEPSLTGKSVTPANIDQNAKI